MPAPRIGHLLESPSQTARKEFEDLLRQATSLRGVPEKQPQRFTWRKPRLSASAVIDRWRARAG